MRAHIRQLGSRFNSEALGDKLVSLHHVSTATDLNHFTLLYSLKLLSSSLLNKDTKYSTCWPFETFAVQYVGCISKFGARIYVK